MFTKQDKTKSLYTSYVYKTKQKVYKHVMFTKLNSKITDTLSLQNKTKENSKFINALFTKQNKKFREKLCLQNKTKLTITLCLQNKTESLQTRYV